MILICSIINLWATEHVYHLPVQISQRKSKNIREQEQVHQLSTNKEIVIVKTADKKFFSLPRWQLDYMPLISDAFSQQQKKSPLLSVFDISQINGGINSQELELLSDTWTHMKEEEGALPFLDTLPKNSLSLLNRASKKVGSGLLYTVTSDYLLPPDLQRKTAEPLVAPLINLLKEWDYIPLEFKGTFWVPKTMLDIVSSDGKKWINIKDNTLFLYDIIANFNRPQKLDQSSDGSPLDNKKYTFSSDGRMVIALPLPISNSTDIVCWDTQDNYKKYTIKHNTQYKEIIDKIALSFDAKTFVFGASESFNTKPDALYFCRLINDNPTAQLIESINDPIKLIIFSPDNRKFACVSEKYLRLYYDDGNAFFGKDVQWDNLQPITSITFNPQSTKFICSQKNPSDQFDTRLSLYTLDNDNFVLHRTVKTEEMDIYNIDFDLKGNSCIIHCSYGSLYYWNNIDKNDSIPIKIDDHGITRAKLSPDGTVCVFAKDKELGHFYTNKLKPRVLDTDIFTIWSIDFNPNSTQFTTVGHYLDQEETEVKIENRVEICQKRFSFDYQDLKNCTVGEARVLSYAHEQLLQHNRTNIVKGTLAYELFQRLPGHGRLEGVMQHILGINIINTDEQKYSTLAIKEIPLQIMQQYVQQNLRKYLTKKEPEKDLPQQPIQNIKSFKEKIASAVSGMGEYIYSYLPLTIQNYLKKK